MDYYVGSYIYSDDALQHSGRKGMKWGEHIFGKDPSGSSNRHGSSKKATSLARRLKSQLAVQKKIRDKQKKERLLAKAEKIKIEEEKEKLTKTQQKEAAIKSGKAADILKFADMMSNNELQESINRIDRLNKLKDLKASQLKASNPSALDKWTRRANGLKTIATIANDSIDSWNKTAKVLNAVLGWDLKVFDPNANYQKKQQEKKQKEQQKKQAQQKKQNQQNQQKKNPQQNQQKKKPQQNQQKKKPNQNNARSTPVSSVPKNTGTLMGTLGNKKKNKPVKSLLSTLP